MKSSSSDGNFDFNETRRIAAGYLEEPHTIPKAEDLRRWQFRLGMWHSPSFQENFGWGVYQLHERGRGTCSMVRQVTWDLSAEGHRFSSPLVGLEKGFHVQPTIEVRDRPLDTVLLDHRLTVLANISFPAFAATGIGIDGESFGIQVPGRRAKIEWWCEGPESWRELTGWAAAMREWLTGVAMAPPNLEIRESP